MNAEISPETQQFDAAELGAMMREMRENLGHDLATVASDLRIRLVYLEAIESGRLADLPGSAYVSGFLRAYSDYLGLDGEEIVKRFRMAGVEISNQTQLHLPSPVEEGRLPTGPILLLAAIVAAAAYGGWYYFSTPDDHPVDRIASLPAELSRMVGGDSDAETSAAPASPAAASSREATETAAPATPEPAPAAPSAENGAAAPPSMASEAPGAETSASDTPPAATTPAEEAPPAPSAEMPERATNPDTPASAGTPSEPSADTSGASVTAEPAPTPAETPTTPVRAENNPPAPTEPVAEPVQQAAVPENGGAATVAPEAPHATVETPDETPPPSPAAETAAATPAPPETRAPASSGARRIVVRATADSFVAVLTSDNQPLFSQLMRAGDSYEVPSGAGLVLETGNAGALEIRVDGRRIPSLGPVGEIRRNIPLDAEKLLSGIN